MPNVQFRIEGPRGCGFRKPGGFYMVADGKGRSCECLPLDVPESIKSTRSPQWVDLGDLTGWGTDRKCCAGNPPCWLRQRPTGERVLLNFVGMSYYRRAEQFERESERMGISRRIPPSLINTIHVGHTVVLLAHREASTIMGPDGPVAIRQVFCAFIPQRIEYIVEEGDTDEYLQELEDRGITLINLQKAGNVLDLQFSAN